MSVTPRARQPERPSCGFTLLELVMVMAIIGIFTAIAAPRYINSIQNYRVKAAAQRLALDLEYAQTRAKTTSSMRSVQFEVAGSLYKILEETMFDDPLAFYSVNLRDEPYRAYVHSIDLGGDRVMMFDGFGQPDSNGAIILRAGDFKKAIMIDGATGEISVEDIDSDLVVKLSDKGLVVVLD